MSRRITPDSSLETLRQEAKDWLRRLRANDAGSRARLERVLPDTSASPNLRDVQHALARELGFTGWTALKAHKQQRVDARNDEVLGRYDQMAANLLEAFRTGTPEAMERHWRDTWHHRSWDAMRRYVFADLGKPAATDITMDDARWLVAREQGFENWNVLADHAAELLAVEEKTAPKGVRLIIASSKAEGASGASTRRWDDVVDALEDEEAIGVAANGQMTDALLERITQFEHVSVLRLNGSQRLTDHGLRHLARLPKLRVLDLSGCEALTDAGFAVLGELPSLEGVVLNGTAITDAGVASLASCELLRRIDLAWTRTGDGALQALRGKRQLAHVRSGALVTDAGLASLHDYPVFKTWQDGAVELQLTSPDAKPNLLQLHGSITDAGLASLVGLDGLFGLNIEDERLQTTPAGLAPLVDLPRLGMLGVDAVDASMPFIAAFPALRFLMCQDTSTSDDGWVALSASRTLEQIWGRRCHNLRGRGFEALAKLPALRSLSVSCLNVPDDSVAALPSFPSLRELMPMDIPDAGYRHIAKCEQLERLVLMYCRDTTDAATEHVMTLPKLQDYFASYTQITDRTPELLATMASLEILGLSACAGVTNAGISALERAPNLRELSLGGMQRVTRDAVARFPSAIHVTFNL
ncbi:MAG TPA: hypothetical protein VGM82_04715 [Gemmatimonadaceae bacterium]|jgi:hypothetical protein